MTHISTATLVEITTQHVFRQEHECKLFERNLLMLGIVPADIFPRVQSRALGFSISMENIAAQQLQTYQE